MDRAANQDGAVDAAPAEAPEAAPRAVDAGALEAHIIDAISLVYDPEIPVNVYEMGLIYNIEIAPDGNVAIDMTLTSPACPVAGTLPGEVEAKVREVAGVADVVVELVWEPFWTPERMTEAARLQLGMM